MFKNKVALVAVSVFMMFSVGCGPEDHDHDNHEENHANHKNHEENHANHENHGSEEHVCVHFESGPSADVTSLADATGELPESFQEHTLVNVTIPAEKTGFLKFSPEEAGEFVLWIGSDVGFKVLDGDMELAAESTKGAAMGCEEDAVKGLVFDLEQKSYTLEIGPTDDSMVSFAIEHVGGHEH